MAMVLNRVRRVVALLAAEEQNNASTTDGKGDGQTGGQSTIKDPPEEDSPQPFQHQDMIRVVSPPWVQEPGA